MAIDNSKNARFMTNNFLESGYAAFDVSSIDDSCTIFDMLDPRYRSQVFKFGGRYLIEEDVNDKMYISGITYQIPAGNYNTAAELYSVINSVLSGIAFCFYSISGYFMMSAENANRTFEFSNTTEAIWETIGFTSGVDVVNSSPGVELTASQGRVHWPYEEITIDFGYQASIGFVGLISDLAEEFKIPPGAEIRIMGNNVNSFVAPPLDQIIPIYDTGAFKFIDDLADSAWRYVKLRITCPNASATPEIGYLYIGDYSSFPERNIGTGFDLTHDDSSLLSKADDGQIYANDKTPLRVYSSLQVGVARPVTVAFLKNIYKLKQLSTPFFVALDPKQFLSTTVDEHLALVRFTSPPKYKHILNNLHELSFELTEAI